MINLSKSITAGLLIILVGGIGSISAQAEDASHRGPASFVDFDKDQNGFVSEEEFNTLRAQRMAAKAAEGKQMRGAASAPAFSDIDTDSDGQINPEELAAGQKAHMGKRHAMTKDHGKGPCKGKAKGMSMKGNMPAFTDFDADGDGNMTEQEFNQGHARKMSEMAAMGREMKHVGEAPGFSGIDTNDDAVISEQEFAAHQAEHHKHMQHGDHKSD